MWTRLFRIILDSRTLVRGAFKPQLLILMPHFSTKLPLLPEQPLIPNTFPTKDCNFKIAVNNLRNKNYYKSCSNLRCKLGRLNVLLLVVPGSLLLWCAAPSPKSFYGVAFNLVHILNFKESGVSSPFISKEGVAFYLDPHSDGNGSRV